MEENNIEELKLQNERLKVSNYILRKENELLMGNIGLVCKDKEELLEKEKIRQNETKVENQEKMTIKLFLKKVYKKLTRRK